MSEVNKHVIIVAGGTGSRMNSMIPKQYLNIGGLPVLMHTIKKFYNTYNDISITLVIHKNEFDRWNSLVKDYDFSIKHNLVVGGETRFQSVKNGLDSINGKGIVAIHDGVRPFVNEQVLRNAFESTLKYGNAIVSVSLKDSIREIMPKGASRSINRENYKIIQTPQVFKIDLLKKAYLQKESPLFTDDASVIEKMGEEINLVEGNYENIKITTPEDLKFSEAMLN